MKLKSTTLIKVSEEAKDKNDEEEEDGEKKKRKRGTERKEQIICEGK